ncbi:MAG: tRNA lysidine(34) synthetase TilS [Muricauda sp.]|nr:tRNA lysidine(34) synthetase TilS [Allomuricauda sp.]
MLSKFKKHVETSMPFLKGKKLLLACSGGLDSVVLTHLCVNSDLDTTLAHCNFNLRAEESKGDAEFVKQLGSTLGIPALIKEFDTKEHAKKQGGSIQMAARELRYQWFSELQNEHGFDHVLTAHHADDDLETFIINLSRGTGIEGLTGIPETNGYVVRPLLGFSREEILGYAQERNLSWREDSSNEESKYLRNKIRHEIVPRLKELHPTFLQNFKQTKRLLQQTQGLAQAQLQEIKTKLFQEELGVVKIPVERLLQLEPLEAYLYGLFHAYGFTDWEAMKGLLSASSGKEVVSKTHRLLKDREFLILSVLKTRVNERFTVFLDEQGVEFPIKLKMEDVKELGKPDSNSVFLDKEKLNFPLVLRNWEKGDYFYPFGMKGKKKLSKFFKDEKVDVLSKEKQWLLCSNDQIVWVVGRRADERFKVGPTTRHILKITLVV